MTDIIGCPSKTCSFEGSISEVADHVTESDDEKHAWKALGHENADEFCYHAHLTEGQQLKEIAQETRDCGKFNVAIQKLESALYHFQRAKLFADDPSSIENRCREVLVIINQVETVGQAQVIDDLVDRAENATDAGDKAHFEEDLGLASQKYKQAVDALAEARTLATELEQPPALSGVGWVVPNLQLITNSLTAACLRC